MELEFQGHVLHGTPVATRVQAQKRKSVWRSKCVVATLEVPAPQNVAMIKEMLAVELEIPAFVQSIMIEGEETELSDEDTVSVDTLFLFRKEPPMISTAEFLESLVYCVPEWKDSILSRWQQFDTNKAFPTDKDDLLVWAMTHKAMKNVPLTRDSICECLDVWMELNDKAGAHPAAFLSDVDRLLTFFEEYCFSPSLLQVYSEPYAHNDDVEFVFFLVARLRCEPQTLMVNTIHLNCWC